MGGFEGPVVFALRGTVSGGHPSLDDFVARWVGVLEVWRAEKNLSLAHGDLQHLLDQLNMWFTGGMFQQRMPALGVFPRKPAASAASTKEQKWGQYRDGVV